MDNNIIKIILKEAGYFFRPLTSSASDIESLLEFLDSIGWNLTPIIGGQETSILNSVIDIRTLVESLNNFSDQSLESIESIFNILTNIGENLKAFKNISNLFSNSNFSDLELNTMPQDILNKLAILYLYKRQDKAFFILSLLSIIEESPETSITTYNTNLIKHPVFNQRLNLSKITQFFTNPTQLFKDEYWPNGIPDIETANEIGEKLFNRISNLLYQFDISFLVGREDGPIEIDDDPIEENRMKGLITLSKGFSTYNESTNTASTTKIGTTIGLLPETEGGPGIFMIPFGDFNIEKEVGNWLLLGQLDSQLFGYEIFSNSINLISDNTLNNTRIDLSFIKLPSQNTEVAFRFGSTSGTRLDIGEFDIQIFLDANNGIPDYGINLSANEGAFIISPSDGDGFIKNILPPEGLQADFDFLLGWAKSRGFHFGGSAGLEVSIPIRKPILGFLDLKSIDLGIKADENGIGLEVGTSGNVELGPVIATVDKIGLQTQLTFPEDGGNLGVMNADLKFKPPSGIGLTLDSKGFKGGGYLYLGDNRYVGVVTLNFKDKINFTAIGILTTKAPDGSEGFSLLLIITADGFKPIQLGLGFTLDGIGGLIALNRTIKVDALREGVRTNAFDNILFPENPVENISIIVQDLETIFPIDQGRFVFGPMAKIGWGGAKSVLALELGLIIEVPNPVRIAIPGVLKTLLPKEDSKILNIKVNFLGTIEFDKKMIAFDASIFDSRLLKITLEGDMAFRLIWGNQSNFLFSVGGFHPAFNPPPLHLPDMRRLSMSLLATSNANISLETYFAVTSNTVQVGARADLLFKAWKVEVVGYIGFDALFQFNPFMFVISAGAMFAVRWDGKDVLAVDLAFRLEGPTPWRAKGHARFKILFVKVKVNFDKTFGEKKDTSLPDVAVVPLLVDALENNDSWLAEIPENRNDLVKIKVPVTDDVVIHPAGTFTIQQELLPLKSSIDKFGNQKTSDGNYFEITEVSLDGNNLEITDTEGLFAPAQYIELEDKDKLNAPSFQKFKSGVKVTGTEEIEIGACTSRDISYETILVDEDESTYSTTEEPANWMNSLRRNGSISKSKLSYQNKAKAKFVERQIRKLDDAYRIVNSIDMTPYTSVTYTYNEARETLAAIILINPNIEGLLQIIPSHELVTISTSGSVIGTTNDALTNQIQENESVIEEMAGAF